MAIKNKIIGHYYFLIFIVISFVYNIKSEEKTNDKILVIPFKSFFPKEDNYQGEHNALIMSWVKRKLYLEISNESKQKIPMILTSETIQMHTRDVVSVLRTNEEYYKPYKNNVSDTCSFDYHSSITYKQITQFNESFYSISKVCHAKEKMVFYNDLNLKQKNSYDIEFIHSSNESSICFFAALQITLSPADQKVNLFYQLKNLINSNSYSWTLKFNSPNEGYLIFGDIINNKNLIFYNDNIEDNYMFENVYAPYSDQLYWKFYFTKLFFGDYIIKYDSSSTKNYFRINFNSRYITVPKEYFETILSKYLLSNETNKDIICYKENSGFYFVNIYCNKKKYLELTDNYKKLPAFNIFSASNEANITFSAKDLFIEKDDKIYFFIAFDGHKEDEWNIGSILSEKYITVFNNDQKKLNILKKKDNSDDTTNINYSIVIIIILIVIFTALIFTFLGLFFGKKLFNLRKKKANELNDDDFDYTPQKGNDKNNIDQIIESIIN